MNNTIKIMWINPSMFIVQKISTKGIVNIGCFSKTSRLSNPTLFNNWIYNKLLSFYFTIHDFENEDEIKELLKQEFYEY